MDRVRLGRALGYGTRHAAKTVAAVVEATAAQNPKVARDASRVQPGTSTAVPQGSFDRTATQSRVRPLRSAAAVLGSPANLGRGARQLKQSFWQPLAVFSGALWLRVTGLFFALIAFTMGGAAWRLHTGMHGAVLFPGSHRFWVFTVFAALFGYFAISSFVRASLKERRAAVR